jgi:PAP2 superfamily
MICIQFKTHLAVPRPYELSAQLQPIIPTPLHGSLPSSHATEAFMCAKIIAALIPGGDKYYELLFRLASRIAVNRTIAGVHYPIDSAAGMLLGQSIAEYLLKKMTGVGAVYGRKFKIEDTSSGLSSDFDFDPNSLMTAEEEVTVALFSEKRDSIAESTMLNWIWNHAKEEWK